MMITVQSGTGVPPVSVRRGHQQPAGGTPVPLPGRSRRLGAFSLIEVLVVIAIIALLMALLLPVLGKAREKARRVVCLSQLRQIAIGCFTYASDYDKRMPPGNATAAPGWGIDNTYTVSQQKPFGTAYLVTLGYLPRDEAGGKLFYCPSWTHPFEQYGKKQISLNGSEYGGWYPTDAEGPSVFVCISYLYRSTFGSGCNQPPSLFAQSRAESAFIADHFYVWQYNDPTYGYITAGFYGHKDGYNAVYLDGHAEWRPDPTYSFYYGNPNAVWNGDWCTQEARWKSFFDLR